MLTQMIKQRVEHIRSSLQDLFSGRAQVSAHCSAKVSIKNGSAVYLHLTCEFVCSSGDIDQLVEWIVDESGYGEVDVTVNANGEVVGGRVTVSYDLRACAET